MFYVKCRGARGEGGGGLWESQRGFIPFLKLITEILASGNPTTTPGFHCADRERPLLGAMGAMGGMRVTAPRDLQRKDVTVTGQLGCNGALLPPSFQRVADLGVGGEWGWLGMGEEEGAHKNVRASSFRCGLSVYTPYTMSGSFRL